MITREFIILNKHGLHARPAILFSNEATKYVSDITVGVVGSELIADAKSVVSILMLRIRTGSKIIVCISGEDEKDAIEALSRLVDSDFKE